jgi:hypothetical protein
VETPPKEVCEHCGSPLDENGLSMMLAEAEEKEPVEGAETDQHAAAEDMHASAFADAIKRRG